MQYLVHVTHNTKCKNNLEKAIMDFLFTWNRQLINQDDIPSFKENIKKNVGLLNSKHKRCRPLKVDWWNPHEYDKKVERKDIYLSDMYFINFRLYASM